MNHYAESRSQDETPKRAFLNFQENLKTGREEICGDHMSPHLMEKLKSFVESYGTGDAVLVGRHTSLEEICELLRVLQFHKREWIF